MIFKSKKIVIGIIAIMLIIAITSIVTFHNPQPTHNPFDPVFNVFPYTLKKQGYVQEGIDCGYTNYYKNVPYGRIYYQAYSDEPFILAKGCIILLDTLCKECVENTKMITDTTIGGNGDTLIIQDTEARRMWINMGDSLVRLAKEKNITPPALFKFDTLLVKQRLRPFEVSVIDTSIKAGEYVYEFLVRHLPTDSIVGCIVDFTGDGAREIQMFTINPHPLYEKPVIKFFLNLFKQEEELEEFEEIVIE